MDLEAIQSGEDLIAEEDLLRECVLHLQEKISQIIEEYYSDLRSSDDTTTYLTRELSSLEADNAQLSTQLADLTNAYFEDSIRLHNNIHGPIHSPSPSHGLEDEPQLQSHDHSKFKLLELNSQLEKKKAKLELFDNLDDILKRFEDFLKLEDTLTGLKVIEYDGNRISLSLRTYVPDIEMAEQNHELAIQLLDGTAEIFPNDVYIGEIIDAAKSYVHQSSILPISEKTWLEWFVRRVQGKIVLSTLRKSLVTAASKSRHSIEYVEKDEIIVAHMLDGVDAYIKVSQGWPITISPLKLLSLKGSSQSSKEVTFSFLCKVEEKVNCLDTQVCQNLSTFIDAIEEIYTQRMRIEIQSDSSINQ